jgi:hypothetical protein
MKYFILLMLVGFLTISITVFSEERIEFKAPLLVAKDTATDTHLATNTETGVSIGMSTDAANKLDVKGNMVIGNTYSGQEINDFDGGLAVEGSVGIGTLSPGYKLDVAGNMHASGGMVIGDDTAVGDDAAKVTITPEDVVVGHIYEYKPTGGQHIGYLKTPQCYHASDPDSCDKDDSVQDCGASFITSRDYGEICYDWVNGDSKIYERDDDDTSNITEVKQALHVTRGNSTFDGPTVFSDNVSITAPDGEGHELNVTGDINFGGKLLKDGNEIGASLWTASGDNIYRESGNVGIGTVDPQAKLYVYDASNASIVIRRGNADSGSTAELLFGASALDHPRIKAGIFFERTGLYGKGSLHLAVDQADDVGSVTKDDARLTINEVGNVGIGTPSPGAELDVNGNVQVSGKIYQNNVEVSPPGTLCGFYIEDSGWQGANCNGHNPLASCPDGYTRMGGGVGDPDNFWTCVKD